MGVSEQAGMSVGWLAHWTHAVFQPPASSQRKTRHSLGYDRVPFQRAFCNPHCSQVGKEQNQCVRRTTEITVMGEGADMGREATSWPHRPREWASVFVQCLQLCLDRRGEGGKKLHRNAHSPPAADVCSPHHPPRLSPKSSYISTGVSTIRAFITQEWPMVNELVLTGNPEMFL